MTQPTDRVRESRGDELQRMLEAAISMARAAGDIQKECFRRPELSMHTKQNACDVVTEADKKSEEVIKGMVREMFPTHGILAEESGSEHCGAEWRWVIDPLDGTTNFSQGLPVFNVSIAVEHNGEAQVGVVFAPYLGELFHAVKGGGAFFNGRRIECSHKTRFEEAVLATGAPYDRKTNSDNNLPEIVKIAPEVRGIRRLGSAALDLCYVAAGFFDGYWELALQRWDVAAGALIAREAGAVVESIRENRFHSVMAACPGIAGKLRENLVKGS